MSEFDSKMVLHHLNSMGFRNISAEQLKSFTKGNTKNTNSKQAPMKIVSQNMIKNITAIIPQQ
jgi:hypothetical protein